MPVSYDASNAPELVRYTFDEAWSVGELIEVRRQLIQAGQLTVKSAVLFDLRRMTVSPTMTDLQPALRNNSIWPVCRAFLVDSEVQHDVAHQLQMLLGPHSVVSEIFQDERKALDWLAAIAERTQTLR